jgi:hypothetical protein
MITLKADPLEATFDPDRGMRLISFRKGKTEVIAGESAPVGPHFGALHPGIYPQPYVDGIARYAPWKAQVSDNTVRAQLTGKDEWNGKTLAALEGQAFKMELVAALTEHQLAIRISIVADADALAGFGCQFKLPKGPARLLSSVQENSNLSLEPSVHAVFHPSPNPLATTICLETTAYTLQLRYQCQNAENSWQLKRDQGQSSVYLAPLAAKSPVRPVLTVNAISMDLQIQ